MPLTDRLAAGLAATRGWRALAIAWALGALATLALPPLGLWPALFVSLPGLVWLLDGRVGARQAFAIGWAFGTGHLMTGIYWLSFAMLVEPEKFAWLIPITLTVLPAALALFFGAGTTLAWLLGWRRGAAGPARVVALAVGWTILDYARGHVLTGFPWNLLGYAWNAVPPVLQGLSLVGIYGLTFLTVLVAASPALLAGKSAGPGRRLIAVASGGIAIGLLVFGINRVPADPMPTVPGAMLRIVQGNIDQRRSRTDTERVANVRHYMALTAQAPRGAAPRFVIWPESASSFALNLDPASAAVIAQAAPADGLLLTGSIRIERTGDGDDAIQAWNNLAVLAPGGAIVASYDKHHLVPFGEFLPLRSVLSLIGMDALAAGAVDFSRGPGPQTLNLPGLPPVSPLICYESLFPGEAVAPGPRPEWLVNVTNDAWFGTSWGPYQHLAAARARAIEQGLPLVRAANTGISTVFDPFGRALGQLDLGTEGVLDVALPRPIATPTLYARTGDVPLLVVLAVASIGLLGIGRLDRRHDPPA
ncbi:apolipoprotein N-acyltransferase [Zavarzinia sp. CC-PAN008]|uniref:apolipoprotein N-acyltransferase n=1 Tax=Zavarzinia sp. CC-PAN008 TaxID=3243332 RepID=UPI003F742B5D